MVLSAIADWLPSEWQGRSFRRSPVRNARGHERSSVNLTAPRVQICHSDPLVQEMLNLCGYDLQVGMRGIPRWARPGSMLDTGALEARPGRRGDAVA